MTRSYHIRSLLILACMGLIAHTTQAQDLNTIKRNFERYAQTTPHEKVFVHTDRQMYLAGEVLWFKTYVTDANTNAPADMSKVAYVEVLDQQNAPVMQGKIGLNYGKGNGSFHIPATVANGNYKVRAYTAWMKNFSPELYFEKQITIVNSLAIPKTPLKQPELTYDIRLFPEGGQLVTGLAGNVAFKAVGSNGKGADVSGAVIDQSGDTVTKFKSAKFGMGHFSFTPAAGKTYKAIVKVGGTVITKTMPDATPTGYTMLASNTGGQTEIKISADASADPAKPLFLLAYQGAVVSYAQIITLDASRSYVLPIDKNKLGEGINHITLFNADQRPVAERLVFKRASGLSVRGNLQPQYGIRKKVSLDIATSTANGTPQNANLSVSVYKADAFNGIPDADITSYLWLTSELKGHIESPAYYFNDVNANTDAALDDLLLTQGWSRYTWAEALSDLKPKFRFLPEYNGHLITGTATTANGAPGRFALVYMGSISKKVQLYGANAGTTGNLLFNTRDLYGPNELVLQTNPKLDTNTYKFKINDPFSEEYSASKLPSFYLGKANTKLLESNSLGMQTINLFKPERINTFARVDSTSFYEGLSRTFKLDDYVRFITIEEVLREYITGANVAKSKGHYHVLVMDPNGMYINDTTEDPLFTVDGIPVFDLDKAFAIDPLKINTLTFVNQPYYWGPIKATGLIALNSYKSDFGGMKLDPKAIILDYEGLQLHREFYSPVYDTPEQQKSRLPDFRNQLYWSPNVTTGLDGKAQVSFFTSDKAGKYIGVLQGLTDKGLAGSGVFTFDVVK